MNRKVLTVVILIAVVSLVALALILGPGLFEAMLELHRVPRH
jgi:hypothetical protein